MFGLKSEILNRSVDIKVPAIHPNNSKEFLYIALPNPTAKAAEAILTSDKVGKIIINSISGHDFAIILLVYDEPPEFLANLSI